MSRRKPYGWTEEDLSDLKELYADYRTIDIANYLGYKWNTVWNKAKELGLQKSEAIKAAEREHTKTQLRTLGAQYRYNKGHEPANKGKQMAPETKEKVKHTFFQKGNEPHNTKWDGYERVDKDGYIKVRVSKGVFELKQRKIWEDAYGKIPPRMAIVFKDRNIYNYDLSNLEMITREELCLRNSVMNYPQEIQEVVRLLGRVNRKINKENGRNQEQNG
jgi:hypothetical protein